MFVKVSKIYDNDASAHPGVPTGWGSISVELRADMVLSDQETNLPPHIVCVCHACVPAKFRRVTDCSSIATANFICKTIVCDMAYFDNNNGKMTHLTLTLGVHTCVCV